MPLISIIIPCHNREHLLPYTLRSAQEAVQGLDAEIIVVDDQSTDQSVAVARRVLPSARIIALEENRGAPFCRNTGLKEAQGQYVLLLDSDDLLEPGFFASKLDYFRQFPETAGVYGPWDYFNGEGTFYENLIIPRHAPYPIEATSNNKEHLIRLLGGWYIHPGSVLWRKSVLKKLGGQNEELIINQDVELMFKALLSGYRIHGVKSGRALIRDHRKERVGVIGSSNEKLAQILELRINFYQQLRNHEWWEPQMANVLSYFCFNFWIAYRKKSPDLSRKFLALSNELNPSLNVRGSRAFVLLGKAIGKEKAVEFKDFIKKLF